MRGPVLLVVLLSATLALTGCDSVEWPIQAATGSTAVGSASIGSAGPGPTRLGPTLTREALDDPQSIAADDDGVVVLGRRADVVSLDHRGDARWRVASGPDTIATIDPVALGAGLVVFPVVDASGAHLRALERATGELRWEAAIEDPVVSAAGTLATGSSVVAVVGGTGTLSILDAADGTVRATVPLGYDERPYAPRVWVHEGMVVVTWTKQGVTPIHAIDAATGALRWSATSTDVGGAASVVGGQVLLIDHLSAEGDVIHAAARALDLATGAEQWSSPLSGIFPGSIAIAESIDTMVVVDWLGRFSAFDRRTGALRWRRATRWGLPRRMPQIEATPWIVDGVVATTVLGTGLLALDAADGRRIRDVEPDLFQTAVTIEGSAAGGGRLVLLVRRPTGEGEVWWMEQS